MLGSVWALHRGSSAKSTHETASGWLSKAKTLTTASKWKKPTINEKSSSATPSRPLTASALEKSHQTSIIRQSRLQRSQKRFINYQIDPKKMRMETGKEAPCRRFYQEKNDPYPLDDMRVLQKALGIYRKFEPDLYPGTKKLMDDFDPQEQKEVDDVLDIYPKKSWYSRPEWFRHISTFTARQNLEEKWKYWRSKFGFEVNGMTSSSGILGMLKTGWTIVKNRSFSYTPERLDEVFEMSMKRHQENPYQFQGKSMPPIASLIHHTRLDYVLHWREDLKDFWRENKPFEAWQVPRGLPEPDPFLPHKLEQSFFPFRDIAMGSSAIEDDIEAIKYVRWRPWHPLQAAKVFVASPTTFFGGETLRDTAIKHREAERRNHTQIGSKHHAMMDIIVEHLPGWNHATHTFYHGRRNQVTRQSAEEAEIEARYPTPLEEASGRPESIPRHMQTLHEWRAFPDPIYSPYAHFDPTTDYLATLKYLETHDMNEAFKLLPEKVRPPPPGVRHARKAPWMYIVDPYLGYSWEMGDNGIYKEPLYPAETDFSKVEDAMEEQEENLIVNSPLHQIMRERGIATTKEEHVSAYQQILNNRSEFQRRLWYSNTFASLVEIYSYLRLPNDEEGHTNLAQRIGHVWQSNRSLPKDQRLTLRRVLSEFSGILRQSISKERADMKQSLGLTDEKLQYMQDYLAGKKSQREDNEKLDNLEKRLHASPSAKSDALGQEITDSISAAQQDAIYNRTNRTGSSKSPSFKVDSSIFSKSSATGRTLDEQFSMAKQKLSDANVTPPVATHIRTEARKAAANTPSKRSYSTATAHSARDSIESRVLTLISSSPSSHRTRLTKPWVLKRMIQERSYATASEVQRRREIEAASASLRELVSRSGPRVVEVKPWRSSGASNSAEDISKAFEMHRFTRSLQQQSAIADQESNIYALTTPKPVTPTTRRPPVTDREMHFQGEGRIASAAPGFGPSFSSSKPSSSSSSSLPTFTDAVWGISKAFGRVLHNTLRDSLDHIISKIPKDPLNTDMKTVVEFRAKQTRDQFWARWKNDLLISQRSISERLPGMSNTYERLMQSVDSSYWGTVDVPEEVQEPKSDSFVLDYVKTRLGPQIPVPLAGTNLKERWETYLEALKVAAPQQRAAIDQQATAAAELGISRPFPHTRESKVEVLKRSLDLYHSAPSRVSSLTDSLFTEILAAIKQAKATRDNAAATSRMPLAGISKSLAVVSKSADGKSVRIDAEALWNDPAVRFQSQETWDAMLSEFHEVDRELQAHQRKEMEKTGLTLSDFERMLFEVQPYLDRILANPKDPKCRVFYTMKLETLSGSEPLMSSVWHADNDKDDEWLQRFREMDAEKWRQEFDRDPGGPMRRRVVYDMEAASLSELLLQFGVTPNTARASHLGKQPIDVKTEEFPDHRVEAALDNYQSHIDYPFLYVKDDGSFVDVNPHGELDPVMAYARSAASTSDRVHAQSARSPYAHLKELLSDDPLFLAKAWVRTMAHVRHQQQIREVWKPLAEDSELPKLIEDLQHRLDVAKALRTASPGAHEEIQSADREYSTIRDVVEGLAHDIREFESQQASTSSTAGESRVFQSIDKTDSASLSKSEYYAFGGMVAALDSNCRTFVPPSMSEAYLDASSMPRSHLEFPELIETLQMEQTAYEASVDEYLTEASSGVKAPQREIAGTNPHLYMPYQRIPIHKALSTRWIGLEPLIVHSAMIPEHISTALMQYMISLRRNINNDEMTSRLQAWLSIRPELLPYIAKLSEYNEKFVKAALDGEPLPYGQDIEKTWFHWTVSDFVRHYTAGYIEDLRLDRLMALSDLHILLFGNDSEKQLLRQKRRNLQRIALVELQQKINGTRVADSLSTCPTLYAASEGNDANAQYTLSARIQNTLRLIGKEQEGDALVVPLKEPISPELATAIEQQKLYTPGETDIRFEGLSHDEKAILRYKIKHGLVPPEPAPKTLTSRARLPDEKENIEMMKTRYANHQLVASIPSVSLPTWKATDEFSGLRLPKEMLPLAGLNPNDWLRPVSAQDLTLQRLHLIKFDPKNEATHGNFPYDWMDNGTASPHLDPASASSAAASPRLDGYAKMLVSKPTLSLADLRKAPLGETEDMLSEQDDGVKLARRAGDADLVRDAKFLFSVRNADLNDHSDERTIRRHEFLELEVAKMRDPSGPPPTIPRRVQLPLAMLNRRNRMMAQQLEDDANARVWLRRKYASWFGQDPTKNTFDVASALNPANDATLARSGASRTTARPLHIPEPTALWGPTRKSFLDFTQEMRFQLALKVPASVETILREENDKFISELEGRLLAYKAMEKASKEQSTQAKLERLDQLDARLRRLEKERSERTAAESPESRPEEVAAAMEAPLSALDDEEFLQNITRELEALAQERDTLKSEVVQEVRAAPESQAQVDDSWLRLQQALDQLKSIAQEHQQQDAGTVTGAQVEDESGGALVPVEEATPEKTPEQIEYDEILETRKQNRERAEKELLEGPKTQEQLFKKRHGRRKGRAASQVDVEFLREGFASKDVPRQPKRRWTPFKNYHVRAPFEQQPVVFRQEWAKSYGTLSKEEWTEMIAEQVTQFNAQVLNGTPQVVRLSCHPDAITDLERFYNHTFEKINVLGTSDPVPVVAEWDLRETDGAYISSTVWSIHVNFTTMFTPEVSNVDYNPSLQSLPARLENFIGTAWVVMESAPERNFLVTSYVFNMDIPDLPRQVPRMQEHMSGADVEYYNTPFDYETEPHTIPRFRPSAAKPKKEETPSEPL